MKGHIALGHAGERADETVSHSKNEKNALCPLRAREWKKVGGNRRDSSLQKSGCEEQSEFRKLRVGKKNPLPFKTEMILESDSIATGRGTDKRNPVREEMQKPFWRSENN